MDVRAEAGDRPSGRTSTREVTMYPQRAIIFALDAILQVGEGPVGYSWHFDPQIPGLLRDYKALGYRICGILDPAIFGLEIEGVAEQTELVAYLNSMLQAAGAPAFDAMHLTDDVTDPRPLWSMRTRFGFDLERSILVATGGSYETLKANAGIGRLEWAESLLGAAYQPAAAI
jgi:hypothetical protein